MELFQQKAPTLAHPYHHDVLLKSYLQRHLPSDTYQAIMPELESMGGLAGDELYTQQLADRRNEPVHTPYSPWGERIDHIEVSPLWQRAERIAAETGLVAIPYEQTHGAFSRLHQFALVYLFTPSTDIYSCPLAMTDGAANTLRQSGNTALSERALPHLTSRDPAQFWTSGQWMTELTGGSDVGRTETIARYEAGQWRLYGRKWFTSATTSQMALTLARPEGNGPGGKGLALFYLEPRDQDGRLQNIQVMRLKDKLGTRKVPTAELLLTGAPAQLVLGPSDGVKNISPMLNITRTWNSVSAIALMRRGVSLAQSYAQARIAFGASLAEKPLHQATLATLEAETLGAFLLTFYSVSLLGKVEAGQASPEEAALLRLLTPITKLTTGKQAVQVLSEVLECFGGAGYVEDTGLPMLLRDAQVLPIWEGTTNVLSLDTLRALGDQGLSRVKSHCQQWAEKIQAQTLQPMVSAALNALTEAEKWLQAAQAEGIATLEAGARPFALTLGRAMQALLLAEHTQWAIDNNRPEASELLRLSPWWGALSPYLPQGRLGLF
jgi:alkylation response protein AidB-like acyl-CoA dehydrogenase